jgi:adenosylcobinamide kinase/adenosylcobinamide-phosphate guanylyltransferase
MIVLVSGGVRSNKSLFAESLINNNKVYIATMKFSDKETKKRIVAHQKRRDKSWSNYEVYNNLSYNIEYNNKEILLDCLTNLVTNELLEGKDKNYIIESIYNAIVEISKNTDKLVIVTNNVFEEVDDYSELTEDFLEVLGKLSVSISQIADYVYICEAGICINILEGQK